MKHYYIKSMPDGSIRSVSNYKYDKSSYYIVKKISRLYGAFKAKHYDLNYVPNLLEILTWVEQTIEFCPMGKQLNFLNSIGYDIAYLVNILSVLFPREALMISQSHMNYFNEAILIRWESSLFVYHNKILCDIKEDIEWRLGESS